MLMELADWKFDVDIPLTMSISGEQASDHCTCGYCRNYYLSVDSVYPVLRPFLSGFGINIEGPDEFCPFEPTIYEATYIIQGSVLQKGQQQLYISGMPIAIRTADESDLYTEHPKPYFTMTIGLMEVPWVLDEPMADVISPANEPEFLERMEQKLLKRLEMEQFTS